MDVFCDRWVVTHLLEVLQKAGAEPRLVIALCASESRRQEVEDALRATGRIETLHQPSTVSVPVPPAVQAHQGSHYNSRLFVVDDVDEAVAQGGAAYLQSLDRAAGAFTAVGTWVWIWVHQPETFRRIAAGAPRLWQERIAAPVFFTHELTVAPLRVVAEGEEAPVDSREPADPVRSVIARLDRDEIDGALARIDELMSDPGSAAADDTTRCDLLALHGTALLAAGDLNGARRAMRAAADVQGELGGRIPLRGQTGAYGLAARVRLAEGDLARARSLLDGASPRRRSAAESLLAAEIEIAAGEPHMAMAALAEGLHSEPEHPVLLRQIGELLDQLGGQHLAPRWLERAADRAGDGPAAGLWRIETLRALSRTLLHAGDTAGAGRCLVEARQEASQIAADGFRVRALCALAQMEADGDGEERDRRVARALRDAAGAAEGASHAHRVQVLLASSRLARRARRLELAAREAAEAAQLAEAHGRWWLAAQAALEQGRAERARAEEAAQADQDELCEAALGRAAEAFDTALRHAASQGAFVEQIRARMYRADVAFWQDDAAQGLGQLEKGVALARARNQELLRFEVLTLQVVAQRSAGKQSLSFSTLLELERLAKETLLPDLYLRSLQERGAHFAAMSLWPDARRHFQQARDIAAELGRHDRVSSLERQLERLPV